MPAENKRRFYILYAAVLFLLIAAGRVTAFAFSHVSVDIAYAPWVADVLQYGTEVLGAAKTAVGFAGVSFALWHFSVKDGGRTAFVFFLSLLLENGIRFCIDFFSSALVYYGVPMALLSLGIQLLYETVFLFLALLIAWLLRRADLRNPEKKGYTDASGARWSILLFMASVLGQEVIYLADHLRLYGSMTLAETAVCTGNFLRIIVIWGGAALLVSEGTLLIFRRQITKR